MIYGEFKMKILNKRRAVTLFEVVIAAALFTLLMLAAYRLFFAEVRQIKSALEHIGVNENARRFFAYLGNDIRNSSWVDFPEQTNRQTVPSLMGTNEGVVCVLRQQFFDFVIKPPDGNFLREQIIEYSLEKRSDGTSDLFRQVKSNLPDAKKEYKKKICEGIREMLVYTTNRKPVTLTGFAAAMPFKNLLTYEPYELDGTGPYLVHVRATFVRKNQSEEKVDQAAHTVKTCFSVRGKLNGVHP